MSMRSFKRAQTRRLEREARRAQLLARRGRMVAGATLGATVLMAANAQAHTWTVTTSGDDSSAAACTGYNCATLRDAVGAANSDNTPPVNVVFDSSLSGQTIDLQYGALSITNGNGVTVDGTSLANPLTVDAQNNSQIFTIDDGNSSNGDTISGLTLTHGSGGGNNGGAVAVNSRVPLTLSGDTISDSSTTGYDGGGGVFSRAPVTIANSTISGNTAPNGGGVSLYAGSNSIYEGSPLTITGSKITGNHATYTGDGGEYYPGGGGVLVTNGTLVMHDSTVSGNTSATDGGGISMGGKYETAISGSKISGNTAAFDGGGLALSIYNNNGRKYTPTDIQTTTISGNQAIRGAGVHIKQMESGAPVTIGSSTISGNTGTGTSFGGGIDIAGSVGSPFRLSDSTVSGNSASSGGGVSLGDDHNHQLIYTDQYSGKPGSIAFGNSTIASNTASAHGGGIYLGEYYGQNQPSDTPPGSSGTATINSTIVSGNQPQDLDRGPDSTSGGFNSAFSLIQNPGTAPMLSSNHDITGKDPKLGPLADNGGPTQTMRPAGDSPVVDQGHAPLSVPNDQIGNARTVDTAIANPSGGDGTDIGSVELTASQVIVPPGPPQPPPTNPGFGVSILGTPLGPNKKPLVVGSDTPVICTVQVGTLQSCALQIKAIGLQLADGGVTARASTNSLTTRVEMSEPFEEYLLTHYPLGIDATAYAGGATSNGPATVTGNVHLLGGASITFPLGGRSKNLSSKVLGEVDQAAQLLHGARSVTCVAYTHKVKHKGKHKLSDQKLTKGWAQAACNRMVRDGLTAHTTSIGRGHASPGGPADTAGGRNYSNRLVIKFT